MAFTSSEIRKRFIQFFEKRGHVAIPSASLVPENDPSVLFNTAGMQPLIPYLLGQPHPQGKRLVNIQKCVRTQDIDEIGDNTHDTFFEMMGNWSLGDYGKKEAIEWSYEFLTSESEGLALNPQRLYVTCFEGDENAPRDEESHRIWNEIFQKNNVKGERIYYRGVESNWWSVGDDGPCGPDTEMFYDLTGELDKGMSLVEYLEADQKQKIVEIWNDVFMVYMKKAGKVTGELPVKNVDTGSGLERVAMASQGKTNIFDTDLFSGALQYVRECAKKENIISERIVLDHVRTSVFMIADGVTPSNTDRGYVLRRLLRRAIRHADLLDIQSKKEEGSPLVSIARIFIEKYASTYPNLAAEVSKIYDEIENEEKKFRKTLASGLKQFEKISDLAFSSSKISGDDAFILFSTYGFPLELTEELALEKGLIVERESFKDKLLAHKDLSRSGSEQKFKGGLAGTSEMETKYHTATHLLHQALRDVLGDSVLQRGSNITSERLRFDFSFERKMTEDEKKRVEETVNEKIQLKLPVKKQTMKKNEAEKTGALHVFGDTYGEEVQVYYLGDSLETAYSKEFCGGPHVENIGTLGKFKIIKEEAVSSGVRRIKAVLE
jgi:alanyl-tRNA synthetase